MRSEVRRLIFVKHTSLSYHIEILTHMSKEDRYQAIVQMSSRLLQFEELYAKMVYQLNKEQKEELSTSQVEWYCSCVEEGQRWSFTVNSLLSSCVLEEEKWVLPVLSLSLDFCSLSSGQWMMRSFRLYFENDGSECVDSGEKREAEEEEVDEEANIIFGSSFDESLAGKIRVSIVATGIGGNAKAHPQQPQAAKIASYIEQSYAMKEVEKPIVPSAEIDSTLEKFSATKAAPVVEEEPETEASQVKEPEENLIKEEPETETQETAEPSPVEEETVPADEEFNANETSAVINEMPKASSLFKAIINNKPEDAVTEFETALSSNENNFAPKSSVKMVEEEPELFSTPKLNTFAPKPATEEPEKLIVEEDDEEYTPTLIERVTGFSIAKRNRKKKEAIERYEQMTPTFSESNGTDDEKLNLEIPSFLRRR